MNRRNWRAALELWAGECGVAVMFAAVARVLLLLVFGPSVPASVGFYVVFSLVLGIRAWLHLAALRKRARQR